MKEDLFEPIIFKVKLELEDFINVRLALSKSVKSRKIFIGIVIFVVVFVTLFNLYSLPANFPDEQINSSAVNEDPISEVILFLPKAMFIIIFAIWLFSFKWIIKFNAKKHFQSNKLIQKEITFIVTEEGVKQEYDSGSAYTKWSDFFKTAETKDAFLLYTSDIIAWIIPKRFFGEDELNRFKSIIHEVFSKDKITLINK